MDPKELSQHLETLRLALEPLSDLSQLTRSSLAAKATPPAASPSAPPVVKKKADAVTGTTTTQDYQPALTDPDLVRALLESGLTSAPLRNSTAMAAEDSEFSRESAESLETLESDDIEIKQDSQPLRHGRTSTPILRQRPKP